MIVSDPDSLYYHVDGEIVPAGDATVSVNDRGFRYGDAAFETLRAYGGNLFEWDAHADRLDRTCRTLRMDHGLSRAALYGRIEDTLEANNFDDAYVRLSITRGVQPGKLTPQEPVDPTVVVYASALPRGGLDGTSVWDAPATLETVETRRIPDGSIPATAKTHNYLNGILARLELEEGDEALLCDYRGYVAEGTTSNVFFVAENGLHTPSTDGPVLPGITRSVVLDLAEEAGIPTHERWYEPREVREADEIFLTNSTWEVRPVTTVDGRELGVGPVTNLLARLYDERIERECYGALNG